MEKRESACDQEVKKAYRAFRVLDEQGDERFDAAMGPLAAQAAERFDAHLRILSPVLPTIVSINPEDEGRPPQVFGLRIGNKRRITEHYTFSHFLVPREGVVFNVYSYELSDPTYLPKDIDPEELKRRSGKMREMIPWRAGIETKGMGHDIPLAHNNQMFWFKSEKKWEVVKTLTQVCRKNLPNGIKDRRILEEIEQHTQSMIGVEQKVIALKQDLAGPLRMRLLELTRMIKERYGIKSNTCLYLIGGTEAKQAVYVPTQGRLVAMPKSMLDMEDIRIIKIKGDLPLTDLPFTAWFDYSPDIGKSLIEDLTPISPPIDEGLRWNKYEFDR